MVFNETKDLKTHETTSKKHKRMLKNKINHEGSLKMEGSIKKTRRNIENIHSLYQ